MLSTEPQRIQQTVSRIKDTVESITRPDGTLVANKISGLINGANASLRAQYNEAERQDVLAILFENLDETSEMFGALAIGTQGILISKQRTADGKEWVWTTAISYAGIMADVITTGILQSRANPNIKIDLSSGELKLQSTTGKGLVIEKDGDTWFTTELKIGPDSINDFMSLEVVKRHPESNWSDYASINYSGIIWMKYIEVDFIDVDKALGGKGVDMMFETHLRAIKDDISDLKNRVSDLESNS